jgi:hypothetical protein
MDEGQHNKAAGTCLLLVLPLPALQLKLQLALLHELLQLARCECGAEQHMLGAPASAAASCRCSLQSWYCRRVSAA